MKILIFTNTSWNAYNFRFGLIDYLIKKKHEVVVLTNFDKYNQYLINNKINTININFNRNSKNIFTEIFLLSKIFFKIKSIKPDIVLNFTIKPVIYTSLISMLIKFKVINTITGLGTIFNEKNDLSFFYKKIYKITQKNVDKIVFQNNHDLKYFFNNKIIVNKSKISLIPGSGINLEKYKILNFKKDIKINFIYIGRLIKDKGILEYIEASKIIANKYNNTYFNILGNFDIHSKNNINSKIISNWLKNSKFKYFAFDENIQSYIENSNCIILPSYREGLSRVLLEASSYGRAIITTNVPGCKDVVIEKVNGFLCKSRDVVSLVDAIEKFLKLSIYEQIKMGKNGRKLIEDSFSEEKIFNQYYDIIKEL